MINNQNVINLNNNNLRSEGKRDDSVSKIKKEDGSNEQDNPLKELMKKRRAELKTKAEIPDVVWLGKEKDPSKREDNKKEGEIKFPKVTIVEKNKLTNNENKQPMSGNLIDLTNVKEVKIDLVESVNQIPKEDEEFYNLNRYLEEARKIADEEIEPNEQDTNVESMTQQEVNNINIDSDTRDYNAIEEDGNVATPVTNNNEDAILNTDNSQIEELRVELENSLGFELFKQLYKIVDDKVILFYLLN